MKTQLLQDIGDSGGGIGGNSGVDSGNSGGNSGGNGSSNSNSSGDSAAAPAKPRPAVWHRTPPGPDTTAQPPGADPAPSPPRPAATGFTVPPGLGAPPEFATAPEPDWLAELMRQDAARADARQKAGRLQRRVFGWSMGAGVLALVAAAALWVIEERRVDGALGALAQTPSQAAVPSLTPPPTPPPTPALAPVLSSPRPAPTIIEEVDRPAQGVATEPAMPGIRREHAAPKAGARAPLERMQADRRKREETLLQCRALGYDEGQCIRRECGMTRFGLACRGGVMGADVPP